LRVLADVRLERGYPEAVAETTDWLTREAQRTGEWAERDRWREWFDEQRSSEDDRDDDTWRALHEANVD
jgi:hypothetical protein